MASITVLTQAPEMSLQAQENRRLRQTMHSGADITAEFLESHTRNIAIGFERKLSNSRRRNYEQAAEIGALRQRIHEYETRISALDAQILERDERLSILNDSLPELENRLQAASQTIHRKDNEIEDLNNRIHEQDSQLQALNESHTALEKQSKAQDNSIEIHKYDIEDLLGFKRSSEAVILQFGPRIDKLEFQNNNLSSQNNEKDQKLRSLQAKNAQKDLELRRLREENAGQLEASVTESNKLRLTVQELNNENSGLKQRASELEKEAKAKVKFYVEKNDDRRSETCHSSSKSKGKKSHSRRG
ncbi:hypothetical protein N7528_000292 [Penicillium herquei]|nr:hypothetical protein N7528_000292 [Penicillium herquei]